MNHPLKEIKDDSEQMKSYNNRFTITSRIGINNNPIFKIE